MMQKKGLNQKREFWEWGAGVPYNNLWSVAVLGHSASSPWLLPKGRGGPAGNWSRLALEARWRFKNQLSIEVWSLLILGVC